MLSCYLSRKLSDERKVRECPSREDWEEMLGMMGPDRALVQVANTCDTSNV